LKRLIATVITLTLVFVTHSATAAPLPAIPAPATGGSLIVPTQGLQFQLGVSDGMIFSVLSQNGYSDIRITKKKLTKARADACRNGKKYDVEISFDGRIRKAKEIGTCRPVINPDLARNILRQKGFRQIQLSPDGAGFIAAACRNNRRFRISLDQFGGIRGEKVLGRCGGILTQYDIAAILKAQGYSRIQAKPSRRGAFTAEACRGDEAVSLQIGRDGAVIRERRTGRCDPPIHPATIPAILARFGFTRIAVIDRKLPRYVAHACRGTQRLEISMNRFGEIADEKSIGRCNPPLNAAGLTDKLRGIGYDTVRIIRNHASGFVAEVCEDGTRYQLQLTRHGETLSEKRVGDCQSRRVRKIIKQFEAEGIRNTRMYVEGCRKRKRVRIELDQHGSVVRRNVIGACR
jgi:hypothetical protein